jgi:hypothetical protein
MRFVADTSATIHPLGPRSPDETTDTPAIIGHPETQIPGKCMSRTDMVTLVGQRKLMSQAGSFFVQDIGAKGTLRQQVR